MKTIGLIGGMSWESTVSYYQIINEEVKRRLGGLHSAKVILYSVEFDEIEKCQSDGDWKKSGDLHQKITSSYPQFFLLYPTSLWKLPDTHFVIQVPLVRGAPPNTPLRFR